MRLCFGKPNLPPKWEDGHGGPLELQAVKRSRVIILAFVLAVVGALLPVAGAFYASWLAAVRIEQNRLMQVADRAITRAGISMSAARTVLRGMAAFEGEPCSPEHISHMRGVVLGAPAVDAIGHFAEERLACSSWGRLDGLVPEVTVDFRTADGIDVMTRVRPRLHPETEIVALRQGAYLVLANPARFADVIADPDIGVGVTTATGTLMATLNIRDPGLVPRLLANADAGLENGVFFAVARGSEWAAVAVEPRSVLLKRVSREQMVLLPMGAFMAIFIIGLVVWLSQRRLSPLGELALAVRNREFIVHYQPLMEIATGACIGAEALVRWRRPDGSMVRPDLFIPLAEDSGLVLPITDQVIEGVMTDLAPLLRADPTLHIAINLAAEDIRTARFLPGLRRALEQAKVPSEQIWLEATERGMMDAQAARRTIEEVRALGHLVAIDDFGTGYSSLSQLQSLPLDALKIDKSFVDTIATDAATSAVTPHIIEMAKALNLRIVAEGVETQAQLDYLAERGVDCAQGWLFSRALSAAEFIAFCHPDRAGK